MTDNIVMFDEFEDEKQIAAAHLGLRRIVVEGKDDLRLFKDWFNEYTESVTFVQASDLVSGSGCTAVAAAVRKSRDQDGIPAFGFVDRDWLFRERHWEGMFALADATFEAATSSTELYTTRRWEIEAYLLEPDLLASIQRGFTRSKASAADSAMALSQALPEQENLLLTQFFYAACHVAGVRKPPQHLLHEPADKLEQICATELAAITDPEGQSAAAAVRPLLNAIVATLPVHDDERWRLLLSFVDTKRLIHRLDRCFETPGDVRWFLAEIMKMTNRRPREIEERIQQIIAA